MGFAVWEKFTFSSGGFKNFLRHRDKNVGAKYGCNKHNRPDYRIGFQIGRVTMQTLHRIYLGLLKPPESNSLVSDSQKYYRKNFIAYAIFFCTTVLCSFHPVAQRAKGRRQSARSADSAPVHHAVMRGSGRMVDASRRRGLYADYPRHRLTRPQKFLKEFFGWFTGPPPHGQSPWGGIFAKPDKMRKRFVILSEVESQTR